MPRIEVGPVGMGFATAELGAVDATLQYETDDRHRIIVLVQALGWALLFVARRWFVGVDRRASRRAVAVAERVG